MRGPTKSIPVNVEDRKNGKPTVHFTPEEEGKQMLNKFLILKFEIKINVYNNVKRVSYPIL